MKRISHMIIALCLPFVLYTPVRAEHSGPYIGALIGGGALMTARSSDNQGSFSLEFDPDLLGSAVLGWDFEPGHTVGEGRIEFEYTHRSNSLSQAKFAQGKVTGNGDVTADSLLLNFFGVFHDHSPWAPYVGIGIGAARLEASDLQVTGQPLASGSSTVFAYQAGAGVDVTLTEHLSLDLGYRFFSSSRPTFTEANGQKLKMDYLRHDAVVGLRVGF